MATAYAAFLLSAFLALAVALAARSRTLRPLYDPQFMQIAWLRWAAPQFEHFERRIASKA